MILSEEKSVKDAMKLIKETCKENGYDENHIKHVLKVYKENRRIQCFIADRVTIYERKGDQKLLQDIWRGYVSTAVMNYALENLDREVPKEHIKKELTTVINMGLEEIGFRCKGIEIETRN